MHRIDGPSATLDNLFRSGTPQIGQEGTLVTIAWLNDLQENLAEAVEGAGIELEKGDYGQLLAAIQTLAATASAAAVASKANIDSPTLTGTPNAPTPADNSDSTRIATTAFVQNLFDLAKAHAWSPGDMKMRGVNAVEAGWYECDGSAKSRTTDAALFAVIGTTWGVGDGSTTFNLPNLRGEHPRGADNGRGLIADSPGHTVGTYLADQNKAHTHDLPFYANDAGTSGAAQDALGTAGTPVLASLSSGAAEARGRSAGVLFVIKR